MTKHTLAWIIIAATTWSASWANAALVGTVSKNPPPAPGLCSFNFGVQGTAGEIINSFAAINVVGQVHDTAEAFDSIGNDHLGEWLSVHAPLGDPADRIYDTYILHDMGNPAEVVSLIGSLPGNTPSPNDGSDPAGLNLSGPGGSPTFDYTTGLTTFAGMTIADQYALTPSASSTHVEFLQVVRPSTWCCFVWAGGEGGVLNNRSTTSIGNHCFNAVDRISNVSSADLL